MFAESPSKTPDQQTAKMAASKPTAEVTKHMGLRQQALQATATAAAEADTERAGGSSPKAQNIAHQLWPSMSPDASKCRWMVFELTADCKAFSF